MDFLTENFSRSEFRCRGLACCGHSAPINLKLVMSLQELRNVLGCPVRVNSGFRCQVYNAEIGSSESSQHCLGLAVDVRVDNTLPELVFEAAKLLDLFDGIGIYDDFVHLDDRGNYARWDERSK